MYISRANGSGIVRPKMSYVPRPVGLPLMYVSLYALEYRSDSMTRCADFADHERSLPWWG